jgi:hypothetical protein
MTEHDWTVFAWGAVAGMWVMLLVIEPLGRTLGLLITSMMDRDDK